MTQVKDELERTEKGEAKVNEPSTVYAERERFNMTRNRWLTAGAIAIALIVIIGYSTLRRARTSVEEAAPAPANPTGTVKFLMEQQWLIRMKLAKAEKQWVARQITSTGRVVPAARNQ